MLGYGQTGCLPLSAYSLNLFLGLDIEVIFMEGVYVSYHIITDTGQSF